MSKEVGHGKRKEYQDEHSQNKLKKVKENQVEIYFDQNIYRKKGTAGKDLLTRLKENISSENCKIFETNNIIPNTIEFKINQKLLKKIIYIQPTAESFIKENSQKFTYFSHVKQKLIDHLNDKKDKNDEKITDVNLFLILESFKKTHDKLYDDLMKQAYQSSFTPTFKPKDAYEVITKLQIHLNINTRETQDPTETSDFVLSFITNLLNQEKEITILDFKTSNTKSTKDVKEAFKAMLLELGIPEIKVNGIMKKYPTLSSLTKEYYFSDKTDEQKANLLTNLECIYPAGQGRVEEVKKKVGKSISEKVYKHFKED